MKRLTAKERLFINLYLFDDDLRGNGTRCAIEAGYSERSAREIAYRLLRKDHIKAYIEKRQKEMEDKIGIKREFVLKKLKFAADRSIPDDVNDVIDNYDPRTGIAALSEISKLQGFYAKTDNSNADKVDGEIKDTVNTLDDDKKPEDEE